MTREERRFQRMLDEAGDPSAAADSLMSRLLELERQVAEWQAAAVAEASAGEPEPVESESGTN